MALKEATPATTQPQPQQDEKPTLRELTQTLRRDQADMATAANGVGREATDKKSGN